MLVSVEAGRILRPRRHQNAKGGAAGGRVALDYAAMYAANLRLQSEAEARSVRLGGDEGIKKDGQKVLRHARAVVMHAEFERQGYAILRARNGDTDARAKGGRQRDLAMRVASNRFGGVLDEIQEYLHQLVPIGIDGRQ